MPCRIGVSASERPGFAFRYAERSFSITLLIALARSLPAIVTSAS